MSIAKHAIAEAPLSGEPQTRRAGAASPLRSVTAERDAVLQPEPR